MNYYMGLLTNNFSKKSLMVLLGFVSLLNTNIAQCDLISFFYHDGTRIRDLSFSSGGKSLIAKTGDEVLVNPKGVQTSPSIQVWDLESKRNITSLVSLEIGRASAISPDGSLLAVRDKNTIAILDLNTKKNVNVIKFNENKAAYAHPVAFTSDNKSILIDQGTNMGVYGVASGQLERDFYANGVNHVFSSDDNYLLETLADSFKVVDFKTGKELSTIVCGTPGGKSEELKNVIFSPENKFIVGLSDSHIRLWDLMGEYKLYQTMMVGPNDNIFCMTSDGRYVVGGNDTLKLFEIKTKKTIITPLTFERPLTAATLSYDNKFLACGDKKGNIKVWTFNDENLATIYFANEIANDNKQIPPKREFEKTELFNRRSQKYVRQVSNKYLGFYVEKITTEKTLQETISENYIKHLDDAEAHIKNSRAPVTLKIDSVGTYNADRETFTLRVVSDTDSGLGYSRTETIGFPLRDNAQAFKQNFQTAASVSVVGVKQLTRDEKTWEVYNIVIKTNVSGKEKTYPFGLQKSATE